MKTLSLALSLFCLPLAAQAHEVWVERDGAGPARIYLGEPGEALPEGGDPEFGKLRAPRLVPGSTAAQVRKAGFIEVAVPAGDVRVTDDTVFAPWGEEGRKEGVIYYARAGRSEAKGVLPLEIAPTAPDADSFVLLRDGKPLPGAKLTVITPDKWSKSFTADAAGRVTLPVRERGRYILSATHAEKGTGSVAGQKMATLYHIATTTFVAE